MPFTHYLKAVAADPGSDQGLGEDDAYALFSAVLDGGVPDLELGALLTLMWTKRETVEELLGFRRALAERVYALDVPGDRLRPIVLPAYGGARDAPDLLPLMALLLHRLGIPVLVHGTLEGGGRVAAAYVLRELGVMPSPNLRAAQESLFQEGIVFVPTAVLSPGLAAVLALRNRLGIRSSAHVAAKVLDPFGGEAVLAVGAGTPERLETLAEVLLAVGSHALLMRSHEGEPVTGALYRPRIDHLADGVRETLFDEEKSPGKAVHGFPTAVDAPSTAAWIRKALAGEALLPHPIVNQLACCLFASGYTDDMNQAKAIAAVEAGGIVPSGPRTGASGLAPASAG